MIVQMNTFVFPNVGKNFTVNNVKKLQTTYQITEMQKYNLALHRNRSGIEKT